MSSDVLVELQDLVQTPVSLSAEGLDELTLTLHELLSPKTNASSPAQQLLSADTGLCAGGPGGEATPPPPFV